MKDKDKNLESIKKNTPILKYFLKNIEVSPRNEKIKIPDFIKSKSTLPIEPPNKSIPETKVSNRAEYYHPSFKKTLDDIKYKVNSLLLRKPNPDKNTQFSVTSSPNNMQIIERFLPVKDKLRTIANNTKKTIIKSKEKVVPEVHVVSNEKTNNTASGYYNNSSTDKITNNNKETTVVPEKIVNNKETTVVPEKVVINNKETKSIPEKVVINNKETKSIPEKVVNNNKETYFSPEKVVNNNKETHSSPEKIVNNNKETHSSPEKIVNNNKETKSIPEKVIVNNKETRVVPEKVNIDKKVIVNNKETKLVSEKVMGEDKSEKLVIKNNKTRTVPKKQENNESVSQKTQNSISNTLNRIEKINKNTNSNMKLHGIVDNSSGSIKNVLKKSILLHNNMNKDNISNTNYESVSKVMNSKTIKSVIPNVSKVFTKNSKIPSLALGGFVETPTVAQIGDAKSPSGKSEGEMVIAPSKLPEILAQTNVLEKTQQQIQKVNQIKDSPTKGISKMANEKLMTNADIKTTNESNAATANQESSTPPVVINQAGSKTESAPATSSQGGHKLRFNDTMNVSLPRWRSRMG